MGQEIYPPVRGLWLWSSPTLEADLETVVRQTGLPALEATETLAGYLDYVGDETRFYAPPHTRHNLQRACVFAALGDLATAQRELGLLNEEIARDIREMTHGLTSSSKELQEREAEDIAKNQFVGRPLGAVLARNDLGALARLLHAFEARTADGQKIRHLWDPTPFPLETGNGLEMEPPPAPGEADDVIRSFVL